LVPYAYEALSYVRRVAAVAVTPPAAAAPVPGPAAGAAAAGPPKPWRLHDEQAPATQFLAHDGPPGPSAASPRFPRARAAIPARRGPSSRPPPRGGHLKSVQKHAVGVEILTYRRKGNTHGSRGPFGPRAPVSGRYRASPAARAALGSRGSGLGPPRPRFPARRRPSCRSRALWGPRSTTASRRIIFGLIPGGARRKRRLCAQPRRYATSPRTRSPRPPPLGRSSPPWAPRRGR